MTDLQTGQYYWLADKLQSGRMEVGYFGPDRQWQLCGSDRQQSLGEVAVRYTILPVPMQPKTVYEPWQLIKVDPLFQVAAGSLIGMPLGTMLGQWSAVPWLIVAAWLIIAVRRSVA